MLQIILFVLYYGWQAAVYNVVALVRTMPHEICHGNRTFPLSYQTALNRGRGQSVDNERWKFFTYNSIQSVVEQFRNGVLNKKHSVNSIYFCGEKVFFIDGSKLK